MSKDPQDDAFQSGPFGVPSMILPVFQRFQLERWAAQAYPLAVCGMLYGQVGEGSIAVVQARRAVAVSDGASSSTDVGELDLADHSAAEAEARELGLQVVGTWRSRPDDAAVPTPDDRVRASVGWSHVIVAIDARAQRDVRSWRFEDGHFVEEELAS